jgi:amidase
MCSAKVPRTSSRRNILAGLASGFVASRIQGAFSKEPNDSGAISDPFASAWRLTTALAKREISAIELTRKAIARIESLDPRINAVVVRDFDRAIQSAIAADHALAHGDRRPLLGLPITVKEAFNVAGLPTTWGLPQYKNWYPTEDAVAVARLKAAGAVVLGKTNVPTGLGDLQTFNSLYGTTKNPWNTDRTPGGSSGGSAAALAAGLTSLELGSDLAGSLRVPAHYCGVYCHKPTIDLVPLRGHNLPRTEALPLSDGLTVVGPLARNSADLLLALDVLAGPDEEGAGIAYRLQLPPARHSMLKAFRVLVIDTHPIGPTSNTIRAAIGRLGDRLERAGATIGRATPLLPDLAEATRIYVRLLSQATTQGWSPEAYRKMSERIAALPDDDRLETIYQRSIVASYRDWRNVDWSRNRLRRQWQALFRDWDVVVCPPMAMTAPLHDHRPMAVRTFEVDGKDYRFIDQVIWPSLATGPGLPATVAPIERTNDGLPICIQIIGPFLEDRTTIAFAKLMEREFGGFVPPPTFAE